jgi:hypothetical protein
MNKLDKEETTNIINSASVLENKLEGLQKSVAEVCNASNLPDFSEYQKYDETAKVGYRIEDIEICLANIDQEISDALNHLDSLKRLLNKKQK